ncbi:hypothetical protein VHEMI03220 [[Torrubiella] hemipterigena]|uniref:Uncharacterized protein n=1 Tax=[Torrubiella] hemipterigena TaxID=1531966 RepID=A0A0A1TAL2_9HYPO|nr:hypothetical protein VHEMI03220 [[Torrubiella] hemipterigena]
MLNTLQRKKLDALDLHLDEQHRVILCKTCKFAIKPAGDRVTRHLGEKHGISRKARVGLCKLMIMLELPDPATLAPRPDNVQPHPYLEVRTCFSCKLCRFKTSSFDLISRHIPKQHREIRRPGSKGVWIRDYIDNTSSFQSWQANDITNTWRVTVASNPGSEIASIRRLAANSTDAQSNTVDPRQSLVKRLREEEMQTYIPAVANSSGKDAALSQPALMTNWMRRTRWHQTFLEADRPALVALSILPNPYQQQRPLRVQLSSGVMLESTARDEQRLHTMMGAVDRLMDRAGETIRNTDVAVRRWLRGRFPDRPYKAPFELVISTHAETQYRRLLKRCICIWVRLWHMPPTVARLVAGRTVTMEQRYALQALWCDVDWEVSVLDEDGIVLDEDESDTESDTASDTEFESGDDNDSICGNDSSSESSTFSTSSTLPTDSQSNGYTDHGSKSSTLPDNPDHQLDALLSFCLYMVKEEFHDGQANSTMIGFFSAICGLSLPDGKEYLRPAQFTTHIAGLIYCIRLIAIEATLPLREHKSIHLAARPSVGQLQLLQTMRQPYLCDGTMSSMGELLSLLAFGYAHRSAEGPSFIFEWSDDNETISWEGSGMLAMKAFRGFVHDLLRQAEALSEKLLYGWQGPPIDLSTIHDRLSNKASGYSFLNDPANKLEHAYLEVFQAASLSPLDALLRPAQNATTSGEWDTRAAAHMTTI